MRERVVRLYHENCFKSLVKMKKVGIVGGAGYTGVELLRILATHSEAERAVITSRKEAGTRVADMFPSLGRRVRLNFSDPAAGDLEKCDVVFFATPNGVAMTEAPALLKAAVRVIDLAADFRIKDYCGMGKFVDVLPPDSHPDTRSVRGANDCRTAVHRPGGSDTVVLLSVIDNLVKGAAGWPVQNMNLMLGLPETTGIEHMPLLP